MIRILIACVMLLGASHVARADDPPPTKEELAQAKKEFEAGNALYKAGKLAEAVERIKESYRLSHNAFLLYNIGHIFDQLGQSDQVLIYFKKFLTDAPANAPMRPDVQKRVEALEAESAKPPEPAPIVEEPKPETTVTLDHQPLDSAPPGVPCDMTAKVSDANATVTLFYRGSGDVKFVAKPMTKHGDELAAHIPATAMVGQWIQYYIEVRDAEQKLLTRNGKSTSPNLLAIENHAKPHFFADLVEPGESTTVKPQVDVIDSTVTTGGEHVDSIETGPPFPRAKWIATGAAGALFAFSLTSYFIASHQHDLITGDAKACGTPPCRGFDQYDRDVESRGATYDTIYKVTLGAGVVATGVAGYFWYRAIRAKQQSSSTALSITPTLGAGFAGATAGARF